MAGLDWTAWGAIGSLAAAVVALGIACAGFVRAHILERRRARAALVLLWPHLSHLRMLLFKISSGRFLKQEDGKDVLPQFQRQLSELSDTLTAIERIAPNLIGREHAEIHALLALARVIHREGNQLVVGDPFERLVSLLPWFMQQLQMDIGAAINVANRYVKRAAKETELLSGRKVLEFEDEEPEVDVESFDQSKVS